MTGPIIRSAVEADLESIRRIYEHDVLEGTASFEIDPPDLEAIRERWQIWAKQLGTVSSRRREYPPTQKLMNIPESCFSSAISPKPPICVMG